MTWTEHWCIITPIRFQGYLELLYGNCSIETARKLAREIRIYTDAAALTNRVTKSYRYIRLIDMDYWRAEWNYVREKCEKNVKVEGMAKRVGFQKGDGCRYNDDGVKGR